MLFSPSDDKIVYGGDAGVPIVYYSFEDSSVHNTGVTIYPDVMNWLTDTTIVYITLGGVDIRILNINDLSENIVVQSAYLVSFRGLANNLNIGAFAYSWEYNSAENTFINLYYPQTGLDTTVYNFLEQGPYPGGNFTILIRDLSWGKNSNKLGFIGEIFSVPISLIYVFDYNGFITYLYSDLFTGWEGNKYFLDWLNRDTVIYSDFTDDQFLFGLDVTTPVSVKDNLVEKVDMLDVKVYPNPFNNETKFYINVPALGDITMELFNCLGESIDRKSYNYIPEGNLTLEWDEIRNNKDLPAGIYFIRVLFNQREYSSQKVVKLVYLK